jgi:hypothetical protein
MSRFRLAASAATISCGLLLGGAGPAAASGTTAEETAQPLTQVVPISGEARNGRTLNNGRFAIRRFTQRGGQLYAVGKLTGRLKGRRVSRTVRLPATVAPGGAQAAQIPPTPGACQILSLTIQPIDLNLLGLRVRTSRIDLLIEGVPGPGNLLGNLLCAITGLLNPNALASTPLGQLVQILNALLALSPRTA